jgi:hypothetical protein
MSPVTKTPYLLAMWAVAQGGTPGNLLQQLFARRLPFGGSRILLLWHSR